MGNHELALARADFLDWFNETARESLVLSERLICCGNTQLAQGLDATLVSRRLFSFMAAPRIRSRNISSNGTMRAWKKFSARWTSRFVLSATLIHWKLFRSLIATVRHHSLGEGIFKLDCQAKYIISVGSVGQPRDGYNNNAKYTLWDTIERSVEIRFVPYDISKTAEKIISLGFPRN